MKWMKGAKEGIVIAGSQGQGNDLTQLSGPYGIAVDQLGSVYVAEWNNQRVMRWPKGATQGSILVGGNGEGEEANQFNRPCGLSFDLQNNLYIVDYFNRRVQKFNIYSS
jgi:DNA-binding beta-propeller fold protein YncE